MTPKEMLNHAINEKVFFMLTPDDRLLHPELRLSIDCGGFFLQYHKKNLNDTFEWVMFGHQLPNDVVEDIFCILIEKWLKKQKDLIAYEIRYYKGHNNNYYYKCYISHKKELHKSENFLGDFEYKLGAMIELMRYTIELQKD